MRQLRHWLPGKSHIRREPVFVESVRAFERLAVIQYQRNEKIASTAAAFRALNLAELYDPCPELARAFSTAAVFASTLMMRRTAEDYIQRASQTAADSGDQPYRAYVAFANSVHWIGTGDWQRARVSLETSIQVATELGDRRRFVEAGGMLLNVLTWQGDWDACLSLRRELTRVGRDEGPATVEIWGLAWSSWCQSH